MMVTVETIFGILQSVGLKTKNGRWREETPLVHQGLDSLDMATFMLEVQNAFGVMVSPEVYRELRTIKSIVEYLNTQGPSVGGERSQP
jgi:acyl carrier protein